MREIFQGQSHGTISFGHTRGHPFVVFVLSLFLFGIGNTASVFLYPTDGAAVQIVGARPQL